MAAKESKDNPGWFKIPGYSKYLANKKGEVLFLETEKVTKGGFAGRYRRVSIYPDGSAERELVYVHILICLAFHGKPKDDEVVLHKNDDRGDNRPSNLSWGTQSKNIQDAYDKGLISKESLTPSLRW